MQFHVTRLSRPVNRLREPGVADGGAGDRTFAHRQAERAKFLAEWTPPPQPEDEDGFKASAIEGGAFAAWKLRRSGRVTAVTAPFWMNNIEELLADEPDRVGARPARPRADRRVGHSAFCHAGRRIRRHP